MSGNGREKEETAVRRDYRFPVIDMRRTGMNMRRLMAEQGVTVRELQQFFGFSAPQAIYRWLDGSSLPAIENLYGLSGYLGVPIDEILVPRDARRTQPGQKDKREALCSPVHGAQSAWTAAGCG